MTTKAERLQQWEPAIRRVSSRVHERFPEMDREEITQECWAWVLKNKRSKPNASRWLFHHVAKYAWKEVTQMQPEKRPAKLYTDREMAVFVGIVLQPKLYQKAHENWRPWLDEIDAAIGQLAEDDQKVLHMRYGDKLSLRQVGEKIGKSTATADRHVWEAIGRLQDILEGIPSEDEQTREYVGQAGVISNAKARHLIARNDYAG